MEEKDKSMKKYKIDRLWNCCDEKVWLEALEEYWADFSLEQLRLERKIDYVQFRIIKGLSTEEFYDFLYNDFFVWKYTAKNRLATTRMNLEKYVKENRMNELEEVKKEIFELDFSDTVKSIKIVSKIRGLGVSGASAFLGVLVPEKFGAVDQFVVKSLLKINGLKEHEELVKMNPENLRVKDAAVAEKIMCTKAAELNEKFKTDFWTPRKIDMILWSIGR